MHLLRKLIFVFGLAAALASQQSYALSLGESELHSALNQPLRADVRLNNLRGLGEDDIIIRLASNADFERAGIERLEFYSQLQFEVMLDHESGPLVRITTDRPVREPYLSFLVEARWASGRLLREYTFLLDLPVYDDDRSAQPVEAPGPEAQPRETRPRDTQPERREPQREAAPEPRTESDRASTFGPVGELDTLWEIALRARPGRDVSVQQTMLAIQRKNPEAFINGNINLLREGQVLRLPTRDEIQNFSRQDAVSEVANHNREWSERAMGAQLDAGQRERTAPREAQAGTGQVRLAAAQNGSGESGQGAGDGVEGGTDLSGELAEAQEELDKTRRDNRELSARVEELEAQIETMESLIEASNEQLRALQAAAQQTREAEAQEADAPQPDADTERAQPDLAEAEEPATAEPDTDALADAEAEAEAEAEAAAEARAEAELAQEQAEAAAEEAERGRRVISPVPQAKSIVDHLVDNLLWIALALLLILLAVYALMKRRAQNAEEDDTDGFDGDFDAEDFTDSQDDLESLDEEDRGIDLADEQEGDADDFGGGDTEPSVEAETGDVVGEADIYIAYGKLDQAEELLLKGLKKEPGSAPILSKLLEVYAEKRDVPAFDQHYASLLSTNDQPAIQRAGDLRDSIPGAGEFDVGVLGAAAASSDDGDDDTALDFADLDGPEQGDDDLDFSFDLDEETAGEEPAEQSGAPGLEEDDEFSFDLDDDEPETPAETPASSSDKEGELESSTSRYDLSFDEGAEAPDKADDDFGLDFTLDDDVPGDKSAQDSGALSLDSAEDDFPELDLKLDDEVLDSGAETGAQAGDDDDWNFDLEGTDTADLDKLDDELSALDDTPAEGNAPTLELEDEELSALAEPSAGLGEEPSAGLGEEPSADLGEEPSADLGEEPSAESGEEPSAESGEEPSADTDREPSAAQQQTSAPDDSSLEDEQAFSLDDLGDDVDLSSLDEDLSDLDSDLDSAPQNAEASPEAPADSDADEDDVFEEALSGLGDDTAEPEQGDTRSTAGGGSTESDLSDEDMDEELDFLADTDEAATKLDLARAYIDMGDADGARDILEEVNQEGNDQQKQEAAELLGRIES